MTQQKRRTRKKHRLKTVEVGTDLGVFYEILTLVKETSAFSATVSRF
ncbi:MAG: hypothetical protein GY880_31300 [Planctomycetaceae bacterium]|nr:hypothetical protein [Planctomycetaceae bacterium]